MRKIEIAIIGVVFGAVPIIMCFLAGWWISIPLVPESRIFLCALAGLLVGVIIDIIFLRTWIRTAYSMRPIVWMMMYLFYSIGMFGFFMGVPVFNVALALPAGFFIGGWLAHSDANSTRVKNAARHSAVFTTSVLGLVCVASAVIAMASSSTTSDLQGMFGIPITHAMIIGIILGGGIFILIFQWWLVVWSVERAYRYFAARTSPSTFTRSVS